MACSKYDDDDLRLFSLGPELAQKIVRIKHNDPVDTELKLKGVHAPKRARQGV